jgi:hypothetical protein
VQYKKLKEIETVVCRHRNGQQMKVMQRVTTAIGHDNAILTRQIAVKVQEAKASQL